MYPVLLADEVAPELTERFQADGPALDMSNKSLLFPVVFSAATQ